MKRLISFAFLLFAFTAIAQEQITIKFVRPDKTYGSFQKIKIQIQGNEYIIKNGGSISINVFPDTYSSPMKIEGRCGLYLAATYFLKPKPNQSYEFEVGFDRNNVYIELLKGEEVQRGDYSQNVDTTKEGKWKTGLKVDKDNLGIGISGERVNQSDAIRQEWLQRGGKIMYASMQGTVVYFRMDLSKLGDMGGSNPGGTMTGWGGGYSMYINVIDLKIPEYKPGISTWRTINFGGGYDLVIYGMNFKSSYTEPFSGTTYTMKMSLTNLNILVAGNFGYTVGVGKFLDEANWKGIAVTLKYRPSLTINVMNSIMTMNPAPPGFIAQTDSKTETKLNMGGFGLDLEFSNYSASLSKLTPKARTKFSFFILPPVGKTPLFISLSLGVSLYTKQRYGSSPFKRGGYK